MIEEDDFPVRVVRVGVPAGNPALQFVAKVRRGPDLAPVVMAASVKVSAPNSFLSTPWSSSSVIKAPEVAPSPIVLSTGITDWSSLSALASVEVRRLHWLPAVDVSDTIADDVPIFLVGTS